MMRISLLGCGTLGTAIGMRLLEAGHELACWNRTEARLAPLVGAGATAAKTPADAAAGAAVAITCLTDGAAVAQVAFGSEGLAESPDLPVHVDMSTIAPSDAARIADQWMARGRAFCACPVLGSRAQAASGSLLVFGAPAPLPPEVDAVLAPLASRVWQFATVEQAAAVKLACNMMLSATAVALGECLAVVQARGVAPAELLDVLGASALGSAMIASKGAAMLRPPDSANFTVSNMAKDTGLAGEECRRAGLYTPVQSAAELAYRVAAAAAPAEDYSAVARVAARAAGYTLGQDEPPGACTGT